LCIENNRHPVQPGVLEAEPTAELHRVEAAAGGEAQDPGSHLPEQEGGGQADQDHEVAERDQEAPPRQQDRDGEQDEEPDSQPAEEVRTTPHRGRQEKENT
jgi:hypothetical protein